MREIPLTPTRLPTYRGPNDPVRVYDTSGALGIGLHGGRGPRRPRRPRRRDRERGERRGDSPGAPCQRGDDGFLSEQHRDQAGKGGQRSRSGP